MKTSFIWRENVAPDLPDHLLLACNWPALPTHINFRSRTTVANPSILEIHLFCSGRCQRFIHVEIVAFLSRQIFPNITPKRSWIKDYISKLSIVRLKRMSGKKSNGSMARTRKSWLFVLGGTSIPKYWSSKDNLCNQSGTLEFGRNIWCKWICGNYGSRAICCDSAHSRPEVLEYFPLQDWKPSSTSHCLPLHPW